MSTAEASRVSVQIPASPTLGIKAKMQGLKSLGVDTISLGAGELKFDMSPAQQQAFQYLSENMKTLGYTVTSGEQALLNAIQIRQEQDYGVNYNPKTEIVATAGGKGALTNLFLTTFGNLENPNYDGRKEVIYAGPFWASHKPILELCGGTMKVIDCPASQDYKYDFEELRQEITPETKYVVVTDPGNPSAASYGTQGCEGLAQVARENPDVIFVVESIYDHYIFDGQERTHLLKVAPDLKDNVVCIDCFSKSDEMAGERVGYMTGPADIIGAAKSVNSHLKSNAPVIGQWLGVAAILGFEQFKLAYESPKEFFAQWETEEGRQALLKGFEAQNEHRNTKIPKLESWRDQMLEVFNETAFIVPKPGGSFYGFPSIEKLRGLKFPQDLDLVEGLPEDKLEELGAQSWAGKEITCAQDFADAALVHCGVGIVPGGGFGAQDCFRISYTEERCVEAAQRLADLANKLVPA